MGLIIVGEAVAFWALLFWLMASGAGEFQYITQMFSQLCKSAGPGYVQCMMWLAGFSSLALPVIEAGLWLHYSVVYAWILLLAHFLLLALLVSQQYEKDEPS